jgi:hypothetical protein
MIGALSLAPVVSAFALSITPSSGVINSTRWEGPQTSQADIDAALSGIIGTSTEQYKQNVGGSESGLTGSYETLFFNSPTDPAEATITYTGGPIVNPTAYLLVKDGNQNPAWYLFNLSALGWTGVETLELTNFWPNQGAISHIALYGGANSDLRVPDGGSTIALLGAALMLIAGIARRGVSLAEI